jgi:hypothetical protein
LVEAARTSVLNVALQRGPSACLPKGCRQEAAAQTLVGVIGPDVEVVDEPVRKAESHKADHGSTGLRRPYRDLLVSGLKAKLVGSDDPRRIRMACMPGEVENVRAILDIGRPERSGAIRCAPPT